jgi:hypothetical protein
MFFIIGAILGVPIWIMVSAITGKMKRQCCVARSVRMNRVR